MTVDLSGPTDAAPPDSQEVSPDLTEYLWELRRIAHTKKELDDRYKEVKEAALAFIGEGDKVMVTDPVTGEKKIAYRRADEVLTVDYDALVEAVGEGLANALCKPPQVDAGRFEEAVQRGLISMEVAAAVASYKPKAAYVGFVNPDDLG